MCGLDALALAGFAVFYAYEIVTGKAQQVGPAVMSALLIALFAVGLYAVARAWRGPETWQRTPTLVWCALLLPVAYTALTSGKPLIGVAVGLSAVIGLWAAATTPSDRAVDAAS